MENTDDVHPPSPSLDPQPECPPAVRKAQRIEADDWLKRCIETQVQDLPVTFSHRQDTVTLPAIIIQFAALSVLFRIDRPQRLHTALTHG